jgi:hypothetical protein
LEKNESKTLTLNDRVISIETHGWKLLKKISINILVIYISFKPYSASIFIIEYFKFDPEVTFTILLYAFPMLISILIARLLTFFWIFSIRYILFTVYLILFLLIPYTLIMPISLIIRKKENSKISKLNSWINDNIKKRQLKLEKQLESEKQKPEHTHIFKSHLALFLLLFSVLFTLQFQEGTIGKVWNPKFNKKYQILTNLHYNCQITGSYNTQECNEWKKRYKEYRLRH